MPPGRVVVLVPLLADTRPCTATSSPGTPHYGKYLEMGWFMPGLEDTTIGEGIGIAQAFEVVIRQLQKCSPSEIGRRVTVSILSDAYDVIMMIDGRATPRSARKDSHTRVMKLVRQKSEELKLIPGFDVTVHLRWVPGHVGVEGNERADVIAVKARRLRRNVFLVDSVEEEHPDDDDDDDDDDTRADQALIERQFEEDLQQWENFCHQEIVDKVFIHLQLDEEGQRWSAYKHQQQLLQEPDLFCLAIEEDMDDELMQAAVDRQLREESEVALSRSLTSSLIAPLLLTAS
ncbi:hypothetical protein NEUTE1DRAFT_141115 [Neurospora tetrasperma FGSC 2508]|uniref:RNase H type-1 domain-containing protein n=1 Tax=Neurospora tetrasperma (strain FGSC 2508 / ATCC MYA-4615 / P0657) TaxID=510951 RepID=F8MVY8_NEUT8|nr:uncharacterized protein NEUTE1DRAFT_141115 [Neurospora tetrasperma FGSC 2508]EGO54836.1 hypothetical protein NEUTE1DRAFT_141115 [Neurospora tetrasperma FGSC 2508]